MNESFKFRILLLLLLAILFATRSNGESSTCVTVYKEGGAPAVFQSPKCPRWTLSYYGSTITITIITTTTSSTAPCQSAILQGRRKSQEDRILYALDIRIPFPGKMGVKKVTVGIWQFLMVMMVPKLVTWLQSFYWSISFYILISFWMQHIQSYLFCHFNKVIQAERMQWSSFICEKYDNFKVASSNGLAHFYVKELTRDHHPDRGG